MISITKSTISTPVTGHMQALVFWTMWVKV
jgi:hypothetical protein